MPRSDIFLTTKMCVPSLRAALSGEFEELTLTTRSWNTYHDDVQASIDQSLADLGVEYVDLLLIHWPVRLVSNETSKLFPLNPDGSRAVDRDWDQSRTYAGLEEALKLGKTKAIGVSNWSIPYLEKLEKTWKVVPAVNQVSATIPLRLPHLGAAPLARSG